MGKDIHPSILRFVKSRLDFHQHVDSYDDVSTEESYIFNIKRRFGLSDLVVVLSDCYFFGDFEYLLQSSELMDGGFILVAKPEAHFSNNTQINKPEDKIIIGKIGILLGALNKEDFWNYEKPKQKKENKKDGS